MKVVSSKGQLNTFSKQLFIVAASIAFILLFMYMLSFKQTTVKEKESSDFKENSLNLLQKLINDENCLAYQYNQISHKTVLDKNKIDIFSKEYREVEPDCAKALNFDYNVKIVQHEYSFHLYPGIPIKEKVKGGVFKKILRLIDGKRIAFILDSSGSMRDYGGKCDSDPKYPNTKICCLKKFMYNFIDEMSDESVITVIPYGTTKNICDPQILFPFTKLDSIETREQLKLKIETMYPQSGTPMGPALENGFIYSRDNNGEVIVLLTDGCENVCNSDTKSVAENFKDLGIAVHTIGYGTAICPPPIKETAKVTNGTYSEVESCEELIYQPPGNITNVSVSREEWIFGLTDLYSSFSPEKSRQEELQISLPVTIRYNESFSAEGTIFIYSVKGELEELYSLLEDTCEKAQEGQEIKFSKQFHFSYPVRYSGDEICMMDSCKKFVCPYDLDFENIENEGDYVLEFSFDSMDERIVVRK